MFRFFRSQPSRVPQKRPAHQRRRLTLESLEQRQTMAADMSFDYLEPAPVNVPVVEAPAPAAVATTNFPAITAAAAAAPSSGLVLTPAMLEALEQLRLGKATVAQRALLFANNNLVNRSRLAGWISDDHFQRAQSDFKLLNEDFSRRAAKDVGGEFSVQEAKKNVFSPGTDSDYIIKITSTDPVGDVRSMQRLYNTNVNKFLEASLGQQQARALYQTEWHNQLDVDFMVDPRYVTEEQFQEVAKLNNDAYTRRLAADYERISRAETPELITDAHFRDYALEMRDFIAKKQDYLAQIRANPSLLKTSGTELHRLMAQEQKYIDRLEAANKVLRTQENLSPAKLPEVETRYIFLTNVKGEIIVRQRSSETLAAQGAVRSPENLRITSTASALAPLTAQRAMMNLSESLVEANIKRAATGTNARGMTVVGQDAGKLLASLPDAEKGRFIDNVRMTFGDKIAAQVVDGMRKEYGPAATGGTPLDKTIVNALRISDDVRGMSNLRRSVNEFAAKTLKIVEKLGKIGDLMTIKDSLVDMKTIATSIATALDPSISDFEADQHFRTALSTSQSLAASGGMVVLFSKVPTLAAMYGAFSLGFDGTRFVLENTELGLRLERAKDAYGDRMLLAYDTAVAQLTELLGGGSPTLDRREQLLLLETNLLRMLREGKATLKEGVKGIDLLARLRSGDVIGLQELVQFNGTTKINGQIAVTDAGFLRNGNNSEWARPMQKIAINSSIGANNSQVKFALSLKQYDELLPTFTYNGAASQGAFVTLGWSLTDAQGRAVPNSPPGSPYFKIPATGTYTLTVYPGKVDAKYGSGPGNPNWSIPFSFDIRVLGESVRVGAPRPMTSSEWSTEIARLNRMSATEAGKDLLAVDADRRIEALLNMTPKRAAEILWTYNWSTLISQLDRMPPERVLEILGNYSTANRLATLDKMSAKRAAEVIRGHDLWSDRVAILNLMSSKRAAEVIGNFPANERTAAFDQMNSKRASEIIWNYGWTDRVAEFDRMTAKRTSEVIWNYNSTDRTATLDRMTSKRAAEVIWQYTWTNMISTLDRMTPKRASEVIWNYSWKNLTATLDRMTAQRAAQVISQYNSSARADVLSRLSTARRNEISKYL
jgi:Mg/Co/Ni transporter MgtE